jgi:exodeoxyribonuclease-5
VSGSPVDRRLTPADLSPDQAAVYAEMVAWSLGKSSRNRLLLTIGGFAGVGKSALLSVFAAETSLLVAYVAFTGRAASVLARKLKACGVRTTTGMRRTKDDAQRGFEGFFDDSLKSSRAGPALCTTIHRLLYKPVIDSETEELKGFDKRDRLDRAYDLLVVDEASMVSDAMLDDLKVHGVPILAVGDHGQLPPVMSSGSCIEHPDLALEKIHRQAADNPIIRLAERVRLTGELREKLGPGAADVIRFFSRGGAHEEAVLNDAEPTSLRTGIMCFMNRTRVQLNLKARRAAGFKGPPRKGEILISLKNKPPVYNGMRGVLASDSLLDEAQGTLRAAITFPDEGLLEEDHLLCGAQFNREVVFRDVEELRKAGIDVRSMGGAGEFYDFGYALTVHRSQGSAFKHAIVYVDRKPDPDSEDWRRWIYTAVTRASERLTIIL